MRTLLDIVRSILSSMNSDDVDRIDATTESMRVAEIVRDTYFELITSRDWPFMKRPIQFDHSGTPERPNYLRSPERLLELKTFEYSDTLVREGEVDYRFVKYLTNDDFLLMTSSRPSLPKENTEVVVDPTGVRFVILNNKAPEFWTTFDDEHIVCDSYNKKNDDALQSHKVRAVGYVMPEWRMVDDFVPDLPMEAFTALLEEARSTCFFNIKQMVNEKAEQKAVRHRTRLSQKSWVLNGQIRYPNYGRRRMK